MALKFKDAYDVRHFVGYELRTCIKTSVCVTLFANVYFKNKTS